MEPLYQFTSPSIEVHTFNNALVGVEVQGQHHVVLLYDTAGSLLDGLGTNTTHGKLVLQTDSEKVAMKI